MAFALRAGMLTLIHGGTVYAPAHIGVRDVLLIDGKIGKVGHVDRDALERLGVDHEIVDATGCIVTPGFVDPHEHLLGGSGEDGLSSQSPMIFLSEIVSAGITTVVGVLGVDTTMKTMAGLLARVRGLEEEGISAYMWSGGYNVPPTTVMRSIREDMLFIDEVIGAGEIAISDARAVSTDMEQLASLVLDTHVGGILTKKAGVTHFHVGEGKGRLAPLRELLDGGYDIEPEMLYPTHCERNEALMDEALELVAAGSTIDIDVTEEDLPKWMRYYHERMAHPDRLTVSSDADSGSPRLLYEQVCRCIVEHRMPIDLVLPAVTCNTARVLKLDRKGRLDEGCDSDVLVLQEGSLDIVEVIAGGKRLVRDGSLAAREKFLEDSHRRIDLAGAKAPAAVPMEH